MFVRILLIVVAINLAFARHTHLEGQAVQKERRSPAGEEPASAGSPSEKNIAELKAAVASPPEGAAKADAGLDSGSGSGSEKIANAEKSDKSRRSADKAGCCG